MLERGLAGVRLIFDLWGMFACSLFPSEEAGKEATCVGGVALTRAPLSGRDCGLDLFYVSATTGPGGFSAVFALNGTAHCGSPFEKVGEGFPF